MANTHTLANRGLYLLLNQAISGSSDIRCLVLTNAALITPATFRDLNTVADVLAEAGVAEAAATNYARQDIAGITLTEDDASDNVVLTGTAPNFGGANIGAGETWAMICYYIEAATDATREVISLEEPASTLETNGGPVTLPTPTWTTTGS